MADSRDMTSASSNDIVMGVYLHVNYSAMALVELYKYGEFPGEFDASRRDADILCQDWDKTT